MLSRPVVLSTLIGLLFGNMEMCFMVGVLFEIIGLVDVPVGTHIPRDDTFAAYSLSLLFALHQIESVSSLLIGLLLIIIFMYPVNFSEKIIRKWNQQLFLKYKNRTSSTTVGSLIYRGISLSFMRGLLVYNVIFLCISFVLSQLTSYVNIEGDYIKYFYLTIIFLCGYLLRFLSFKSVYKYLVFLLGLFLGWLI